MRRDGKVLWCWCRFRDGGFVVIDTTGAERPVLGPVCCLDGWAAVAGRVVGGVAGEYDVRFRCGTVVRVRVDTPRQWDSAA